MFPILWPEGDPVRVGEVGPGAARFPDMSLFKGRSPKFSRLDRSGGPFMGLVPLAEAWVGG